MNTTEMTRDCVTCTVPTMGTSGDGEPMCEVCLSVWSGEWDDEEKPLKKIGHAWEGDVRFSVWRDETGELYAFDPDYGAWALYVGKLEDVWPMAQGSGR